MQQGRIKELLAEASSSDCDPQRLNAIQCELGHETAAMGEDGVYNIDEPHSALSLVVDALFVSTAQNRREAFPDLLPVFSLLCGDRKDGILIADIDWSQVDAPKLP